jgi:hypothetical protein
MSAFVVFDLHQRKGIQMIDRRTFLANSLLGAAAVDLQAQSSISAENVIVRYQNGKFGPDIKNVAVNGVS